MAKVSEEPFGALPDGTPAVLYRIEGEGVSAAVTSYGAHLVSLKLGGVETVLGHGEVGAYLDDDAYLGSLVGRVAGRIGGAAFPLDGETVAVAANAGANQLHGGPRGFSHRVLTREASGEGALVLRLVSEDGDQGFPGAVTLRVTFEARDHALRIAYAAESTAPTPLSLTHHPYFSLGGETVTDHRLRVNATAYTPLTEAGIPTGVVAPLPPGLQLPGGRAVEDILAALAPDPLDHGLVCPDGVDASLSGPDAAVRVTSDQTHLQVYAGHKLAAPWRPYQGLALEPQGWPDAEKHPGFPARILRPGEAYRRHITYAAG